jgi:hypothetical protein
MAHVSKSDNNRMRRVKPLTDEDIVHEYFRLIKAQEIILAFTNTFNNRNLSAIDKLVEVNSIDHQALGLQGREEVKMFFKSVYTAFPDFHTTTIDRMVSGGNKVAGFIEQSLGCRQ